MKKLLSLVVAAGMLMGSSVGASATDIKVKGRFDFGFGLYDGTNFAKHDNEENFDALQRFRTQVDFIASESLKGVAAFEVGNTYWGYGGGATWGTGNGAGYNAGGAMGSDGISIEVKHMYLDWLVPQTDLQVRMGIQPFALPRAVTRADGEDGGYVLDDDLAGILLSYNFNENFGANLGWFRPWDGSVNKQSERTEQYQNFTAFKNADKVDLFALTLPMEFKNQFSFTPYATYALIGENADFNPTGTTINFDDYGLGSFLTANGALGDGGDAWWAGFAFDFTYLDPFVAALDFTYGSYSADDTNNRGIASPDRSGWVAIGKLGYKLDYFTPIMFGWYGSGSDDISKDGLDGIMPFLSPDWGLTSFGWSNAHFGGREYLIGATPAGTWAIGLGLEDIKFIERLTSQLRVLYFRGTSDTDALGSDSAAAFYQYGVLGKDDSGIEVNLDNVINVYENLDMFVELAYIHLSLDNEAKISNGDNIDTNNNAWKSYVGFTYSF